MTAPAFSKSRCRNHPARQAACRCPGCGFDFCRECVTEHHERLLCSRCMAQLTGAGTGKPSASRTLKVIAQSAAGILAAWIFFFLAGELVSVVVAPQHEVHAWHAH